ncbi:MAG: c-type cytochrome [Flavobacterium lindanitolerans]|uniref:cbb3-type cytochrome c oxidase N-terminal domain-containing protein n=1 Tax=Flavobacterium lindanitolerans TaxID=428988 RepID=UPI001A5C6079|nr:cbb3-type cytochrome c oxidase N-terminal domain-containing protein [Flavobacterium lindanitolerans]MBL7867479.1 c-type cytochrome [Flavobacterium lindanitolerans]
MKKIFPVYLRVPIIFFAVFLAMEYFIDSGDRPAFLKYPMISVFLVVFLFLLIAIEVVVAAVDNVTYHLLTDEQRKQLDEANEIKITDSKLFQKIKKWFVKESPIEQEADIMLNHDYDGIKELDNDLPPWWTKLFYACIVFAFIYLAKYHIFGHDNQAKEFETEMAEAKLAVEEYKKTAKDLIDAETVTLLTDTGDIAAGKTIFETNCVACHRPDAGGAIGPNLTDDHWILGGGIKNVFHTITEGGRDGKGMVAWKGTLKPSEIQQVASYVLSLQGSNPKDPKPAEGEIWVEENAPKADTKTEEAKTVAQN